MHRLIPLVVLGLLALMPRPAAADTTGVAQPDPVLEAIFDALEERLIRDYYGQGRDLEEDDDDQATTSSAGKKKGKGRKAKHVRSQGIPPGHLPPPGLCRAWLPDVPPGHQPPPDDCRTIKRNLPAGAFVVYGGPRARHDQLPEGLGDPLPWRLANELPPPADDLERVVIDDDVYLIQRSTRIIVDVLLDVLTQP